MGLCFNEIFLRNAEVLRYCKNLFKKSGVQRSMIYPSETISTHFSRLVLGLPMHVTQRRENEKIVNTIINLQKKQ